MSGRREMHQLVRDLEKCGFTVTRTGSGHWMVRNPGKPGCVVLAFSPKVASFHRSLKRLREIGYEPTQGS